MVTDQPRTIFSALRHSVAAGFHGKLFLPVFVPALFLLQLVPALQAQTVFFGGNLGSVNVGGTLSTPASITFMFKTGATLGSVAVLTQGVPQLDFTDAQTGTCAANTAYAANATCTVNVNFAPQHPGARYGAVELLDASGNLLSTGYIQGTGIGPQVTFAVESQGNFVPASPASLGSGFGSYLHGAALDGTGDVFVADSLHNAVKEILAAGGYTTVNSVGSGFIQPNDVAVDGAGNVFVADSNNFAVKEILAVGGYTTVNTLVSKASGYGAPTCVAVDGAGNVFAGFVWNGAIYEFLASSGYTTANTLGQGVISDPYGVAVDGADNVFVADANNNAVYEIVAASSYKTVNTLGSGFSSPERVTVDAAGDVFVLDDVISEMLAVNGTVPAQNPTIISLGWAIGGIAVDGSGNVFLSDVGPYTYSQVFKYDYADAPILNFDATLVGSTSPDSPQTVALINDGNAPLEWPSPGPTISSNFTWNWSAPSSCPYLGNTSLSTLIGPGSFWDLPISFTPVEAGTLSGQLVITDDALHVFDTTQTIELNGTAAAATSVPTTTKVTSSVNPYNPTLGVPVIFTATVTAASGATVPTGTVQLSVNGVSVGSPVPLSGGVATFADSTLMGCSASITAAYTPSGVFAPSISPALIEGIVCVFPVLPASGFSINGTAVTVTAGATTGNTTTITITPVGGFTGNVALSAAVTSGPNDAVLPPTFSFGSTSPVNITGSGAGTATLTIATSAEGGCAAMNGSGQKAPWYVPGGAALAVLMLFGVPRKRRWRAWLGLMLLLVCLGSGVLACNAPKLTAHCNAITPPTTSGTYIITVTGTSGSTTASGQVTLNVQ